MSYAVIFVNQRTDTDDGYDLMAAEMEDLAIKQTGYIKHHSVRDADGKGITVSYWDSLESIAAWKSNVSHMAAQKFGKEKWYLDYQVSICKVEREYSFNRT